MVGTTASFIAAYISARLAEPWSESPEKGKTPLLSVNCFRFQSLNKGLIKDHILQCKEKKILPMPP